jgi:hypothetical protein
MGGTDPRILHADIMASRYLGDYNERIEAGKNDRTAERLYAKAQYWLDRLNALEGNR